MNQRLIVTATLLAVTSTQMNAIGFTPNPEDPTKGTLTIDFPSKGERPGGVYQYEGVSQETYDAFVAAPSKGIFFGENIKGSVRGSPLFPYERLTDDEVAQFITKPTPPAETKAVADDPGMADGGVNAVRELETAS